MFPGLAVSSVLVSRGHRAAVILSGRAVEGERSLADIPAGAETLSVPASPFSPRRPLSMAKLGLSFLRARSRLAEFGPDALLAMGSYTSAAPVIAARSLGIPVVLHEANAIPGSAVAFLARFADAVCTSFPDIERRFRRGTVLRDTGLPLRASFESGCGGTKAPPDAISVLVMGGSQGARDMNRAVVSAFAAAGKARGGAAFASLPPVRVVHLAGKANEEEIRTLWRESGLPGSRFAVEVVGFEHDMARRYAEASVCISRAGASSCFELALAGLPTFFVPLPGLARDHQTFNARSFAEKGAAEVVSQAELAGEDGAGKILEVLETARKGSEKAAGMRRRIMDMARPDAAGRVADAVEESARRAASARRRK